MRLKRKICGMILAAVMLLVPLQIQAEGRFYFSDLTYVKIDGQTQTYLSGPENGVIQVSVNARYSGNGTGTVYFILTYAEKTTGKLLRISYDQATLTDGQEEVLTAEIELVDLAKGDFKYYLWDGLTTHMPLENNPPAKPTHANISNRGNQFMTLEWDTSDDDQQNIFGYNIYNQGLFVGSVNTTQITETHLDSGDVQNYEIEAVDDEGILSEKAKITGTTSQAATCILAPGGDSVVRQDTLSRLSFWVTGATASYGYTEAGSADGRPCRVTTQQGARIGRFHFIVDTTNYIQPTDNNVVIEMTYFDEGTTPIYIQYNNATGGWGGNVSALARTNSMRWKVGVVKLTNVKFTKDVNSGEGYANFRIYTNEAGLKLYKVSVCKLADYQQDAASMKVTDGMTVRDLDFYTGNSTGGAIEYDTVGGIKCLKAQTGKYFEVDVNDTYLPSSEQNVVIEVEYLDNITDDIVLEYNSLDSANQTETQSTKNTNAWRKMKFSLGNAKMDGRMTGGILKKVDFRLSSKNSSPLYIKAIRVYRP